MQWMLPPPKATSRVCTPTTSRSGNISCTCSHGEQVVLVAVLWKDDRAVDDQEVHIRGDAHLAVLAGDRPLDGVDRLRPFEQARLLRQAELMHLQAAALGVGRLTERTEDVLRLLIKRMVLVLCPDAGHLARPDEAGHVVDVAVRLVGVDAVA